MDYSRVAGVFMKGESATIDFSKFLKNKKVKNPEKLPIYVAKPPKKFSVLTTKALNLSTRA